MIQNPKQKFLPRDRGFALILTISIMVLIALLAVGLLGLSTVALRTSERTAAGQLARANARMAMIIALGELQRHAGADTRITARADILSEDHPPILGVWQSWEGDNHNAEGRPISPGDYGSAKQERFRKWLVSTPGGTVPDALPGAGKVALIGEGSVGAGADRERAQVHLLPSTIEASNTHGAFAWWIGGENLKTRLPEPSAPENETPGQWASRMKSAESADPAPFGLTSLLDDASPAAKAITLKQADLLASDGPVVSRQSFHDLSTVSTGLLTNTATGGWKKDLSLFTENSSQNGGPIRPRNLPLFRLRPDQDTSVNLPRGGDLRGRSSVFYPWSDYRGSTSDQAIYQHPAVASWNNLIDYTLLYRQLASGDTRISARSYGWNDPSTKFEFLHQVRILPLIARIQWVYSHFSVRPSPAASPPPPADSYQPCLVLTPVITLWNPYNLQLRSGDLRFDVPRPLPTAFRYRVGSSTGTRFIPVTDGSVNYPGPSISGGGNLRYRIPSGFTLEPGETRVFSPTTREEDNDIDLQPGYDPGKGHLYRLKDERGRPIYASGSDSIDVDVAFDTAYLDGREGVGIYLDMRWGQTGSPHLVYRMVYTPEVANAVYPIEEELAASEPLNTLGRTPTSFLTTIFGARMASRTHLAAKGLLQSSPLVNYTAMGGKDVAERTIGREYRGTNHPVNSPFDYSFRKVGTPDTNLPDVDAGTGRGFIVTGFQKSDGLSRCVMAEIPTRPLQSLAELQHWDLRYENPIPPFAFNLIGNSNATPLIAADSVIANYRDAVNLQHDDSYCANHLLFDDWFFSSIAPDPSEFGTSGRDLQKVFTDFVTDEQDLPNSAYQPIAEDLGRDAGPLFSEAVDQEDSWKTIASRLEVEGMFNVNSTSVVAWRALLGHARNQKIPYLRESSGRVRVALSEETDHATSRFSVAGDSDTSASGSSGAFPGANEFTGYRILDDTLIDALAEEIVEQVRRRGPFLSLAEFVNRQLSSGDLALSGAIQSALDELANNDSTNLYKGITSFIDRPSVAVPGGVDPEYAFPAAAEGQATFGLPGWTRQADILRPLAPILNVRDDTFTIRTYGDARDPSGRVTARAWCEAVVRRTRDYIDPADEADLETFPESPANRRFGRRFEILSFRWLAPAEI